MSTNRVRIPHVSFLVVVFVFAHVGASGAASEQFYFSPPGESIEKQDRHPPSDVGLKPEVVKALKSHVKSGRWETSVREDGIRFHFDLEDMGRLGLLVVARGRWQDKELIPEWFVEQLESKQTHGARVNYDGPDDGRVGLDPKKFPEAPYGFMTWVNTDGDHYPGADRAWAWAAGTGGSVVLWNHRNGIVFAGFGINAEPTPNGIPHIIESCIASDNPLTQGGNIPASQRSRVSERGSDPDSVTNESSSVPLWELFETELVNYSKYSNPFRHVTLSATFTSPSGKPVHFFGYYDGDGKGGQIGNVWKLRFMPDEIGIWSYTCQFSDGIPAEMYLVDGCGSD